MNITNIYFEYNVYKSDLRSTHPSRPCKVSELVLKTSSKCNRFAFDPILYLGNSIAREIFLLTVIFIYGYIPLTVYSYPPTVFGVP